MEPKHIEEGRKALRVGAMGEFFLKTPILNEGTKLVAIPEFLVDTGFSGYMQIRQELVDALKLEIIGKNIAHGFDGMEKELGITKSKIKILGKELENFPIQIVNKGPYLLGTRLFQELKVMLVLDYTDGRFTATVESRVKEQVRAAVDQTAE